MQNREELIRQLATASGISDAKYIPNRYDSETGTLYCNGHAISSTSVENAKKFFESQKTRYQQNQGITGAYEMMTFFEVAIHAIEKLQETSVSNGGKVVVKE